MAQNKKKGLIIGLCILAAVAVIGVVLGFVISAHLEKLPILQNVKVAGVDVGGMTADEAAAVVTKAIGDDFATNDITLQVYGETVTIPASYSGGTLNVEKAVRAARNYGQFGFPGKVGEQKQLAASVGYSVDLERYMDIDKDAIMQILNKLEDKYSSKLTQSTWNVDGKEPSLEELAAGNIALKLVVNLGTPKYNISADKLYAQIIAAYGNRNFTVTGNCTQTDPDPVNLEDILSKHQIAAQDAYWDTATYKVVESKCGLGFDAEEAKKLLAESEWGSTVTIPFVQTQPEMTTEALNERLFRDTLSTFTAESSSNAGRKNNLKLACQAVNGIILNPGETFDYNTALGKRTTDRGYKAANAYVGGETVQTIGGGICQVSSTIYYCALMADLEIVTRRNHSYPSTYIPLGMDATVSWGGPEFRFRNNTQYPIKIVATASGGDTTIALMSYDDRDYYVKMEYEVLSKTGWSVVYKDFPADNAEGYKNGEVISTPYTGYVVNSYRVKYDKATNKEISRTFEAKSSYKKRDKVIARVADPTPSVPTTPSTPDTPGGGVTGGDILDQLG